MNDELDGKIKKEFLGFRAKTYSYLTYDNDESKKAKRTLNCVIKKLKFEDYKICVEAQQLESKIIYL